MRRKMMRKAAFAGAVALLWASVTGLARPLPSGSGLAPETAAELRRIAEAALKTPVVEQSPSAKHLVRNQLYCMNSGFDMTPKGRIWTSWVGGEDGPRAYLIQHHSDDGGKTWSETDFVIDPHVRERKPDYICSITSNFWTDPDGRLHFFFDQSMGCDGSDPRGATHMDGRAGVWEIVSENPDDAKPTWSEPRRIGDGHALNKPIVARDGTWYLPVCLNNGSGLWGKVFVELDARRGVNVYASTDRGKTWEHRGNCRIPRADWHEPQLVELKDGRLWLLSRCNHQDCDRGIMQSFSDDGGRTWAEASYPELNNPIARFVCRKLKSGHILLVCHGRPEAWQGARNRLTAWLSRDDGKTWEGGLLLDGREHVSYPDAFQATDGSVWVQWDHMRAHGEIRFARIAEADILAGEVKVPGSFVDGLVASCRKPEKRRKAADDELSPIITNCEIRANSALKGKKAFYYCDDVIWLFRDLTRQRPKSMFDNPFLKLMKEAHDKYGMKVQLNCFYRTDFFYGTDEFTLKEMTDAYKAEWQANKDWLRLGFHSLQEFPDYPFINADYKDMKRVLDLIGGEIARFAGEGVFAKGAVVHWGTCSKEACRALKDAGFGIVLASCGPRKAYNGDPSVLPYGHAMRLEQNRKPETCLYSRISENEAISSSIGGYNNLTYVQAKATYGSFKYVYDREIGIGFKELEDFQPLAAGINLYTMKNLIPTFEKYANNEFLVYGNHEQYFYGDYLAYQPEYAAKVLAAARFLKENGYEYFFFGDLVATPPCEAFVERRRGKLSKPDKEFLGNAVQTVEAQSRAASILRDEDWAPTIAALGRWNPRRAWALARQGLKRLGRADGVADRLETALALWKLENDSHDGAGLAEGYAFLRKTEQDIRASRRSGRYGLVVDERGMGSVAQNVSAVLCYRVLRDFASKLNRFEDAVLWTERGTALEKAVAQELWDGTCSCFADRNLVTGAFAPTPMAAAGLPFYVGCATCERADEMVRKLGAKVKDLGDGARSPADAYRALKGIAFCGHQDLANAGRKNLIARLRDGSAHGETTLALLLDWEMPRTMELPAPFVECEPNPAWVVRSYWMDGWTASVSRTRTKKYFWECPGDGLYDATAELMNVDDSVFTGRLFRNGTEVATGRTIGVNSLGIVAAQALTLKKGDRLELVLAGTEEATKKMNLDAFAVRRRDAIRAKCLSAPDAYHAIGRRKHQGIPSVAVSKGGRLWATWYANVNGCETAENFAILATSADNGETWREVLIADPDLTGLKRAFDPEVWVTPDNRLLWTWSERVAGIYAFGLQRFSGCGADPSSDVLNGVYLDAEKDPDLAALPDPFVIARGVMMCKPIVRGDGSWLLPVARWYADPSSLFYESRDNGRTFAYLGGATVPEKARTYDEQNVVELADGTLKAWIRTTPNPGLMESVSKDGGRTWTLAAPAKVRQCSSRVFVTKLRSGNLVMVKNGPKDVFTDRERLTAILSRDGGETWEGGLLLDGRRGVSYPDGCEMADGSLFVVYDRNRTVDLEVLAVRFTEAEILAGGEVKPRVLSAPTR